MTNTFSMTLAHTLVRMLYYSISCTSSHTFNSWNLKTTKNTTSAETEANRSDGLFANGHNFVQLQVSAKLKFRCGTLDKCLPGAWNCCLSWSAKCLISQLVLCDSYPCEVRGLFWALTSFSLSGTFCRVA